MTSFRRRGALFLSLALGLSAGAQEAPAEADAFPLLAILETSRRGVLEWQPDWPLDIPPDAFSPSGEALSIVLHTAEGDYTLRQGAPGRLAEFPFPFEDEAGLRRLYQVALTEGEGFTVTRPPLGPESPPPSAAPPPPDEAPGEGPLWIVEFLEQDGGEYPLPLLCRVRGGTGGWFFAALEYRGLRASETWFDAGGAALGIFNYTWVELEPGAPRLSLQSWTPFAAPFPPEGPEETPAPEVPGERPPAVVRRFYDSYGSVSGLKTPAAEYRAQYRHGRPRYWTRPVPPEDAAGAGLSEGAAFFSLQWDERGLLARLSGSGGDGFTQDSRYTYTLDGRGNWTERRETVLIRRSGYLVPAAEVRLGRSISYPAEE
jgi:hypothetical protein